MMLNMLEINGQSSKIWNGKTVHGLIFLKRNPITNIMTLPLVLHGLDPQLSTKVHFTWGICLFQNHHLVI